ncbi:MAG TPA: hypothetical protein VGJ30_08775, partial [Candidatus Angelobacter sp.]
CLLCGSPDWTGLGAVAGTGTRKWIALDNTLSTSMREPALEPYRIAGYLQSGGAQNCGVHYLQQRYVLSV